MLSNEFLSFTIGLEYLNVQRVTAIVLLASEEVDDVGQQSDHLPSEEHWRSSFEEVHSLSLVAVHIDQTDLLPFRHGDIEMLCGIVGKIQISHLVG